MEDVERQEFDALAKALCKEKRMLKDKERRYKGFGMILLLGIPITSAVLSVLVAMEGVSTEVKIGLGLGLTIMTIVNSAFNPSGRFTESCELEVKIDALKWKLVDKLLQKVGSQEGQNAKLKAFCTAISETMEEFRPIQYQHMRLCLPETPETIVPTAQSQSPDRRQTDKQKKKNPR